MRLNLEGIKKITATAVVTALVWTTPGFEFYAAAEDILTPVTAPATGERALPNAGAGSGVTSGAGNSAVSAGVHGALGSGVTLPGFERPAAAPSGELDSSAGQNAAAPSSDTGLRSQSDVDASGLSSEAALTPSGVAVEHGAVSAAPSSVKRPAPKSLDSLKSPSLLGQLRAEAPTEDFREASERDFRRLTGEVSAQPSASDAESPVTGVAAGVEAAKPQAYVPAVSRPGSALAARPSSIPPVPQVAAIPKTSVAAQAMVWARNVVSSAAGFLRGGTVSSQQAPVPANGLRDAAAVAIGAAPALAAAGAGNGVVEFSGATPSRAAAAALPQESASRRPEETRPEKGGWISLPVMAVLGWSGWASLRLAAHVSAQNVPVAAAAVVTRGVWWHYVAGKFASVALVPVVAVSSLFFLQAMVYYFVTWIGSDVTQQEFTAFLAREARSHPALYRGLLGYSPGGGILKGAFAPAQRPFGALGFVGRYEIFVRPELVRIPWLFRLVLRAKLQELSRQLGRAPPASRGLLGRALNSLSFLGVPVSAALSGVSGRLPQAVFLDRVLHETGVSLRVSDPYEVLMVSRPQGPVEASDFQWLSDGKASVSAVAEPDAAARAKRAESLLDDPFNRGRFRAIYLDDPQDWAPQGKDAKALDFTLQRMEKVYREALPLIQARTLSANKPLSSIQLKVWNHVAGAQVAQLGLVKLASRLYQSLDDGGVAVIPFQSADSTLGPLQAVLRHWASSDGGYFRLRRLDQPEGGNVLIAQKVEPRVKVWLKAASGATVPTGLQNVSRDPVKKQAADEILKRLGFESWLPEFREIGLKVLHIQGEDVGETRVYASVPRAQLRYVEGLLAPGQLETSDASFRLMTAPEAAAAVEDAVDLSNAANGLYESVPREKGPEAWALAGRGEGMLVYDSDTGIQKDHRAFGGRADETDYSNSGNGDKQGHGTHTAGDMVADDGRIQGTAPAARVHMGKVFGPQGASDGDIEASWGEGQKLGADAFNNSLGGEGSADHPLAQTASGMTRRKNSKGEYPIVVASAGNSGQDDVTVGPPGAGDEVLTVAAADKPGPDGSIRISRYSSGGWAFFNYGFGLVRPVAKPEIAGGGGNVNNPNEKGDVFERGIVSSRSKDAEPGPSDEPGGLYTRMSGTSMSGPQVTGASVIVKSGVYKAAAGNPEALAYAKENLPFVVKMLMMSSAEDMRAPAQKTVAGFLNMEAAVRAADAFRLGGDAPGSWRWIERARAVVDAPRAVYEAAAAAAAKTQEDSQKAGSDNQTAMNAALRSRDAAWDKALETARPLLVAGLQDPAWLVRQYSAFGLLALQDAGSLDALTKSAASDPDARVRQMALQALAELPASAATPEARSAVANILQDPAQELRAYAALALARWNDAAGVKSLVELTASSDEVARYGAVWALGQIGLNVDSSAVERLAALVASAAERGEIRDQAAASMKKLLPADAAFSAKAISDLLNVAGPTDLLMTRGVLGFFQAAAQRPAMAKRLSQEPLKGVLAAFAQKYRSSGSKQGGLGNLVRLVSRLSGSTLGTPPMIDPSGDGVPGVDETMGPVHLIVELPSPAAKLERSLFAAPASAQAAGVASPLEQALSAVRFPMEAVNSFGGKVRAILKEGFVTIEIPGYSEIAFAQEMARKGYLVSAAGPKYLYLKDTGPLSGLPGIHGAGVTGVGTVTLVIDEGLDVPNPAFAGKVLGVVNTSGDGAADDVSNESIGHGTHTGNIAAGQQRPDNNPNIGRAPDSFIIAAKVLGANGGSETTVMEGISGAVQILDDVNAKLAAYWQAKDGGQAPALPDNAALAKAIGQGIRRFVSTMNLSLGGPGAKDAPMNLQLRKLHIDRGIMVSVAAGNDGPQEGTANGSSPSNEWSVKTVGAADKDKKLTFYSSRGTPDDPIVKIVHYGGGADLNSDTCPYLPGGIISALSAKAAEAASQCIVPNAGKPTDQAMSGTSMASPHSAGDDALILQKVLTVFTPQEIETTPGLSLWMDRLAYQSAAKMDGKPHEVGAGLRDVKAELAALDEQLKDKAKIVADSLELYKQAKARDGKESQQRWSVVGFASGNVQTPLWALVWRALSRPLARWAETQAARGAGAKNGILPARRDSAVSIENSRAYGELRQMRDLLSAGAAIPAGGRVGPFVFHTGDTVTEAPRAGLEGFYYAKRDLERRFGADALLHHQDDFFSYLDAQLGPFEWTRSLREDLARLRADAKLSPSEKNARMNAMLDTAITGLRARMTKENPAAWAREARIYELFPRAFNLRDKRLSGSWTLRLYQRWRDFLVARGWAKPRSFFADMSVADFKAIKSLGMDTVWAMGIYPIGLVGRGGSAGGSPYAVYDYTTVNPELGTMEDFRAFVKNAHRAGLKVIVDFVPNHTAMDSLLLQEHPEYFMQTPVTGDPQRPPQGAYLFKQPSTGRDFWIHHGGYDSYGHLATWDDTAQLDYSRADTRAAMSTLARDFLVKTGIDGYRVDMAYQLLNEPFARLWNKSVPAREFLEQFAWEIKVANPAAALIAEAYAYQDRLSAAGFDAIYNKSEQSRDGQEGYYDALRSRDPRELARALEHVAFLSWQVGGAAGLQFSGNHDEVSPQREFGDWMKAALFLTLLLPGAQLFYGSQEVGFDRPAPNEPKPIPFSVPTEVDWSGADPAIVSFYKGLFHQAKVVRDAIKQPRMSVVGGDGWVGYVLEGAGAKQAYAVLSNPGAQAVEATFQRPDLGVSFSGRLNALETKVVALPVTLKEAGLASGAATYLGTHFGKIAGIMSFLAFFAFLPMMPAQIRLNWQYYHLGNLEALKGVSTLMMSCGIVGNLLNLPGFLMTKNPWFITGCMVGVGTTWIALLPLYLAGVFPAVYFYGISALIAAVGGASYAGWRASRKTLTK